MLVSQFAFSSSVMDCKFCSGSKDWYFSHFSGDGALALCSLFKLYDGDGINLIIHLKELGVL